MIFTNELVQDSPGFSCMAAKASVSSIFMPFLLRGSLRLLHSQYPISPGETSPNASTSSHSCEQHTYS